MESSQTTHFFDVIKKEVVDEHEGIVPVMHEHTNVKQEYHYKEELDLAWDEDDNELENKENIHHALNNSSRQFDYPMVLVERLSYNAANNPLPVHQRENPQKILSVQADNRKKLLQHYRKICPKCNEIGSPVKPTTNCKYCNEQWHYQCTKCMKQYTNQTSIIYHLKSKCLEKEYYFACFKCNFKSACKYGVNRHLKDVHSIFHSLNRIEKFESDNVQKDTAAKLHKCSKCGEEFKKLPPFLRHMQVCCQNEDNTSSNNFAASPTVLKGKYVHYCVKCNKTVKDDIIGNFHQKKCKICDTKFFFKCKECNKMFPSYSGVNGHLKISHPVTKEVFKCHQCDYKTCFMKYLTKHVVRSHFVENQAFSRPSTYNLKDHLVQVHSKEDNVDSAYKVAYLCCDNCTYKSKCKSNLVKHVSIHLDDNKKECPKCKKYLNQEYLKKHEKYCGKGLRCNQCNQRVASEASLSRHIANMHSGGTEIDCPRCGKTCKNKIYMSVHLRHCGTNPHLECDFCSYKTKYKHDLKKHIEAKHSKSKKPRLE